MNLSQALRFSSGGSIAFTGAGGKTTAMFTLARQLPPPVILAATTHLHVKQIHLADSHWIAQSPADVQALEGNLRGLSLVTGPLAGARTTGVNPQTLEWLHAFCGCHNIPLLVEADGSRQRPLKAPAAHEPVIPRFVQAAVVVAGLSGLGQPLGEAWVFRPEIFSELTGLPLGGPVSVEALARVLAHPQGGLKGIPEQARRIALLNQADTPELQARARRLAELLLPGFDSVVVSSFAALERAGLEPGNPQALPEAGIHAVHERVAGILLAAGEARRFGRPKQLLEWRGKSLVRRAAETALEAGLAPLVVVTGAYAEGVTAALQGLPVEIVHNPAWESGQAASIQAGLRSLTPHSRLIGAAVFLLADQPGVTPALLRSLVERHAAAPCPILAPLVDEQRANPVLFDRDTFPDLLALNGDVGGRAIFPKYRLQYLPWHATQPLLDIDTPEDWQRLQESDW